MRWQAEAFLKPLADAGLFGDGPAETAFQVICDDRLNTEEDLAAGQVNLLVSVRATRPDGYRSFLITHGRQGSRVRPVRSNVLPAGLRLRIEVAPEEHLIDVVVHDGAGDAGIDVEAIQPREAIAGTRSASDDPTTPVEALSPPTGTPIGEDETTLVAELPAEAKESWSEESEAPGHPAGTDQHRSDEESTTLKLRLPEGAAAGGLDRDDIARFYTDFGGRGERV